MKKALVQDNFIQNGGAEKCISTISEMWEDLDYFSLTDFLNPEDRKEILNGKHATTSFIQKLPFSKKLFRHYLPFYPLAIEQLDLREYDLVLSSSYSVAKGVLTNADQVHVTYMHSPVRYAWDLYFQYLEESNLNRGLKSIPVKAFLHYLRQWDMNTVHRPDYYIANSKNIASRIKKIYNKEAKVIYPPVETKAFNLSETKEEYYITFSRMVSYKKIDLIVEAFSHMPEKRLVVCGDGPDLSKIKKLATSNIELRGHVKREELIDYLKKAKAFVFAANEDFGISPVEAQACGVPVIALGKGGSLETVKAHFYDQKNIQPDDTGVFFREQTVKEVVNAVTYFESERDSFDPQVIRGHALQFDKEVFKKELSLYINSIMNPL